MYSGTSNHGHLSTTDRYLSQMVKLMLKQHPAIQRTPLYNGHLYTTDTSMQRTGIFVANGKINLEATSNYRTDTSIQRTPLYNGQLHLSERCPLYGGTTVPSLPGNRSLNTNEVMGSIFTPISTMEWDKFSPSISTMGGDQFFSTNFLIGSKMGPIEKVRYSILTAYLQNTVQ